MKLIGKLLKAFIQSSETASFKKLYSDVGKKYKMTYQQVERNIRYAVQKSDLWELGIKNSKILLLSFNSFMKFSILFESVEPSFLNLGAYLLKHYIL